MNNVDCQYLDLLKDIMENGIDKETRSGWVRSVFGRTMRFNLQDGFPILTTKKVFTRGFIHELLWFLSSDTNIKYLVDNNVHIWDDDAYRWFKTSIKEVDYYIIEKLKERGEIPVYCITKSNGYRGKNYNNLDELISNVSKEQFIEYVKDGSVINLYVWRTDVSREDNVLLYTFGYLGNVYGKQWRDWRGIDQIKNVIETLKTNPNDRRMIVSAWNVSQINRMALPPCHYAFQFYARPLNNMERLDWLCKNSNGEYDEWKSATHEQLDKINVPKYGLSLMWHQRSCDFCLGIPYNISSYSLLCNMIAQCVNMIPDELICTLGDTHIYHNHFDGVKEQLSRDPYKYNLPKLWLNPDIKNIDDFKFEDIRIENYESYPVIKFPLSVG